MKATGAILMAAFLGVLAAGGIAARGEDGAGAWKLEPDVAAYTTTTLPASAPKDFDAGFDLYRTKVPLALSGGSPFMNTLTLPDPPSKYGLLSGAAGGYELWNLKTGVKEKIGKTRLGFGTLGVSPDGQYIACVQSPAESAVDIVSAHGDKVVARAAIHGRLDRILGFAGPSRLVATQGQGMQFALDFFLTSSGAAAGEIPVEGKISCDAFSANGKYLALLTGTPVKFDTVMMIDAAHGKTAGQTTLNQEDGGGLVQATMMGFSPDGKELAIVRQLLGRHTGAQITILSAATGQVVKEKFDEGAGVSTPMGRTEHNEIQWSPDGARLIAGMTVIDRGTLEVSEQLAEGGAAMNILGARWADPTNVVLFERGGGTVKTTMQRLGQKKENAAAIRGGLASRAHPALVPGAGATDADAAPAEDLSGAAVADMGTAEEVVLDPLPEGAPALPALVGEKGKLMAATWRVADMKDAAFGENVSVSRLMFTGEEAHLMLVEESLSAMGGPRKQTHIQRFDIVTGTAGPVLSVDGDVSAVDVSPTGDTLAVLAGTNKDVVKIYRFKDRAYREETERGAFHPFGVAEAKENPFGSAPEGVATAQLVDDEHLLATSNRGRTALIDLKDLHVVWAADQQERSAFEQATALSPDHAVAAICTAKGLVFVEALSGKVLGALAGPEDGTPFACVFSQDATRVAVASGRVQSDVLDVYDLKTGKRLAEGPEMLNGVLGSGGWIEFLTPDFLMSSSGDVFSVKRGTPVWKYQVPRVSFGSTLPARRFVYPVSESRPMVTIGRGARARIQAGPPTPVNEIVSAQLPQAEVTKVAAKTNDELFVWHPHMSVKLDVTVTGEDDYRKAQLATWKKDFEAEGFTVDDHSANVLHANSFLMAGPATTYRRNKGESVSISQNVVGYTISLTVGGKEAWRVAYDKAPENPFAPPIVMLSMKPGESAQQAADRENPKITQASQILLPPLLIAREGAIGTTRLGAGGPEASRGGEFGMPRGPGMGRRR